MSYAIKPCDPSRTHLQQLLAGLVRDSGVPQAELARRVGFSEKHVSQMLTGRVEGTLTAWQVLLDAAGVELISRQT